MDTCKQVNRNDTCWAEGRCFVTMQAKVHLSNRNKECVNSSLVLAISKCCMHQLTVSGVRTHYSVRKRIVCGIPQGV